MSNEQNYLTDTLPGMEQYYFIIILFAVVALVIVLRIFFSKGAIVRRKLKKAVVKRITDFRSGETAKFIGKVDPIENTLHAPLSQRECAMYYVHVEQRVSTGKSSHWRTIIEETRAIRFLINDGTACAYVNSHHLKSYIVQDWKNTSGFMNDASPRLEQFLNTHGYRSENAFGMNKHIRYREGVLEPDELVAVLGTGNWRNGSDLDLPEEYDRVLSISAAHGESVYLSDDETTVKKKTTDRYSKHYQR